VKFVVDCQLPPALAHWLRDRGFQAAHVFELGMAQSSDRQIWESCVAHGAILASKDEDFLILATRPGDEGRLLWMRLGNCRTAVLLRSLEESWPMVAAAFESGQRIVELRPQPASGFSSTGR
jgi:predicted nuclease of predicted toxin-antitoxin system